jgi:hypothetical protein
VTDLNPEIFNNPNLGDNNHLPTLDAVEMQKIENLQAKTEGRIPRQVRYNARYGVNGIQGPEVFDSQIEEVGFEEDGSIDDLLNLGDDDE